MATSLTVGQKLPLTIAFLDKDGQPLATTPTPDAPPSWANTNQAAVTLDVPADGLSATASALATGDDVVQVTVVVGGQSFAASLSISVAAAPQGLASIAIVPGTPS